MEGKTSAKRFLTAFVASASNLTILPIIVV